MLVYRSVWIDDSLNTGTALLHETLNWLRSRGTNLEPAENERRTRGGSSLDTWSFETEVGRLVRIRLTEQKIETDEVWTTTATSLMTKQHNTFWVDVHAELSDVWRREISAPTLVKNLLLAGGEPRIGSDPLEVQPRELDDAQAVVDYIEWMEHPQRQIPLLLFAMQDGQRMSVMQRATRAAETLAAMASVATVEERQLHTYNRVVDADLHLAAGDVLLVMGSSSGAPTNPAPYRISEDELGDDQREAGLLMARRIGMSSQWPRVPEEWSLFKPLLGPLAEVDESDVYLHGLDVDDELQRLRRENDEYIEAWVTANEMLEDSRREICRLEEKLTRLALADPPAQLRSRSIAATIAAARHHLKRVEIPVAAERDIELLDRCPNSGSWADELARALSALESFAVFAASTKQTTDFITWCGKTGMYPDSKVAAHEGKSTKRDHELLSERLFPVATQVNPTGLIVMLAHIKIQMRGGGLIPRLYFFDDTRGVTAKVHVGFIGPHRLVQHAHW